MNTKLKPIPQYDFIERPQFAIDEPYRKPRHKMPYFEDASKRVPEPGAVKIRLSELTKKNKVVVVKMWWEVWG